MARLAGCVWVAALLCMCSFVHGWKREAEATRLSKLCAVAFCPAGDVQKWDCPDCVESGLQLRATVVGEPMMAEFKRHVNTVTAVATRTVKAFEKDIKNKWASFTNLFRFKAQRQQQQQREERRRLHGQRLPLGLHSNMILTGKDDLRAMVLDDNASVVYVIFKGTESLSPSGWLLNFDFPKVDTPAICPRCQVHGGFWQVHMTHRDEVYADYRAAVKSLKAKTGKPVRTIVAGHSLGGALACLFAFYVQMLNVQHATLSDTAAEDITVYTFGEPRVGNLDFALAYDKVIPKTFRVVHGMDTVTQVPPQELGFRHEGICVYCEDDAGLKCTERVGEENPAFVGTNPLLHAKYMGVDWWMYMSVGTRERCTAKPGKLPTAAEKESLMRKALTPPPPTETPSDAGLTSATAATRTGTVKPKPAVGGANR